MNKEDNCNYCHSELICPSSQCLARCKKCRNVNLFLCHVLPEPQNLMNIKCSKCHKIYSLISCESCSQTMAFEQFKSGFPYVCKCGNRRTYLQCPKCSVILSLPGGLDYQKSLIKCKNCKNQFCFTICQSCQITQIRNKWQAYSTTVCSNPKCKSSENQSNPYGYRSSQIITENLFSGASTQQPNYNQEKLNQISEKQICKICLVQQAIMINTKCYHLSVCFSCSLSLKNICPICRSQDGQYHKVYKS